MRTLVIHPHDPSTHFLKAIYEDIPIKTVITGGLGSREVKELIKVHKRIIMLGHGSPRGLFGMGFESSYVIGEEEAGLLRDKECIFIWCHANQFVEKHKLKGFYSGMFVSEVGEAVMYHLNPNARLIEWSNHYFARTLGSVINKPIQEAYEHVKKDYGLYANSNDVVDYNCTRLGLI